MSELPSITPLESTPPNRFMQEDAYVPAADSFAAWMPVVAGDIEGGIQWMHLTFEATDQAKQQAAQSAQAAAAARDKSQEWAESEAEPEPGSQSAKTWAGEAEQRALEAQGYKESTEVVAAAQAAAGLPSLAGNALKKLGVKEDESGVEWQEIEAPPQELSVGQIVLAPENNDATGWLKLDNSTVLRSAYPQLASYADRVLATELLVYEFSYPSLPTTSALSGVAYGNGIYIATGQTVLTSTDGVNWVDQGALIPYSPRIAFGNGLFVAVGSSGNIHTTTDGVNWTQQVSGTAESINTVTYINSMFVACGSGLLMSSTDGVVWAIKTTPFTASLPGIAFGNGVYVSCFSISGGDVEIWSSSDLENWTLGFQGDFDITPRGINYINGWFYLLGGRRSYSYAKIIRFQSPSGPWDDITPAQAGQNTSLYIVTEQAGDTLLAFGDYRAVASFRCGRLFFPIRRER